MIDYANAVLLVDIEWSGRVFRFASESVTVNDGVDSLLYDGGLSLSFEAASALLDSSPEDSANLGDLVFPVDVALWHRQGRYLTGSPATVRVWSPGLDLSRARVIRQGTVSASEYGENGQPVAVIVDPPSLESGAVIVEPDAAVNLTTWPDRAEAAQGRVYSVVFGAPGLGSSALPADRGGSPAPLVDTTGNGKWVISGERVAATSVTLVDATDGLAESLSVAYESDGSGRTVAVVEGTGTTVLPVDGNAYWVDWSGSGGGVIAPGDTTAAMGAGSQILWLLDRAGVTYDRGAWESASGLLNRYRLSWYADRGSPLDEVKGQIADLLPLSIPSGGAGLYPVVWRWRSTPVDAVIGLEHTRNVYRDGGVTVDASNVRNEHGIAYAPRASDGDMTERRTITGRQVDSTQDLWRDLSCAVSWSHFGHRPAGMEEVPRVYEGGTASLILADRAIQALPVERMTVDADVSLGWLSPGDVVTYTDSTTHHDTAVALVEGVARDGGRLSLGLVIIPQPARDLYP